MSDVKRKVGLLPVAAEKSQGLAKATFGQQGDVGNQQGANADVAAGTSRQDKNASSLLLWKEWAEQSLGQQLVTEPTHEELHYSEKRLRALEKKCQDLQQRTQRRLAVSAALRATASPNAAGSRPASAGVGQTLADGASAGETCLFSREAQWAARERRRSAAYESVRQAGARERDSGSSSPTRPASPEQQPLKSHQMLARMLWSDGNPSANPGRTSPAALPRDASLGHASVGIGLAGGGSVCDQRQPSPVLGRVARVGMGSVAHSPAGVGGVSARSRQGSLGRPWSAVAGSAQGSLARSRSAHMGSHHTSGALKAAHAAEVAALQQELDELRAKLDEAQHAVETKSEMEAQLREAMDILRARVAAQGARELDHQRRLQQHARLEPIFDRLAECFVFRSPEEVVARLEFLEDEKLGSFDELLRAHEEVAQLQQQLEAALTKVEVTRTQVTSQHLESAARLQARNVELQGELESLTYLNRKLEARQHQLVSLQGAVLDLWGRCQQDNDFVTANQDPITHTGAVGTSGANKGGSQSGSAGQGRSQPSSATTPRNATATLESRLSSPTQPANGNNVTSTPSNGGGGGGGGGGQSEPVGANAGDLEAILALIKELLVAKTPTQAARYYQAMQQVAHRVWAQHFTHKRSIRGKIVETFEALSNLAEIMAAKIRTTTDQLERSRTEQTNLRNDLEKLQVQKRALQVALQRRDELVRNMSGVPKGQRQDPAAAYQSILLQDAASWTPSHPTHRHESPHTSRAPSPSMHTRPHSARQLHNTTNTTHSLRRPASARSARSSGAGSAAPRPPPAPTNPIARGTLAAAQAAAAASTPTSLLTRSISFGRPLSAPASKRIFDRSSSNGSESSAQAASSSSGNVHINKGSTTAGTWTVEPLQLQNTEGHGFDSPPGALFQQPRVQDSSVTASLTALPDTPRMATQAAEKQPGAQGAQQGGQASAGTAVSVATKGQRSAVRWVPPRRSDIEAGFLSRLERAAAPYRTPPPVTVSVGTPAAVC